MRCRAALWGAAALALAGAVSGCGTTGPVAPSPTAPGSSGSAPSSPGPPGPAAGGVVVVAVYQPLCGGPEPVTPDPGCPEEVVAGVEVTATDASGAVVARATTDGSGRAVLDIPAGAVTLTAGPAEAPRIAPRPTQVTAGTSPAPTVTLRYESSFQ